MPNYPTFPSNAPQGTLLATLYHPSTLAEIGQSTSVLSAKGTYNKSAAGNGSLTIPLQLPEAERALFQAGYIVSVFVRSEKYQSWLEVTCFKIERKRIRIDKGFDLIHLSGPDLLHELGKIKIVDRIYSEQTTIFFDAAGPSGGESSAYTSTYALTQNYAGYSVRTIDWSNRGVVESNTPAVIYLDGEFTQGEPTWPLYLVLYGHSPRYSGLGGIADAIIEANAPSWTFNLIGSQDLTRKALLAANGESILETLINLTKQTGDLFRLSSLTAEKKIDWLHDAQATFFALASPTFTGQYEGSSTIGIITNLSEDENYDLVTRVIPYGTGLGDGRLTIKDTDITLDTGFDWVLNENGHKIGIRNVTLEAEIGAQVEVSPNWSHIKPANDTTQAATTAANALVNTALVLLDERSTNEKFYTVDCVTGWSPLPGNLVTMLSGSNGQNFYNIGHSFGNPLYIQSVSHSVGKDGVRYTQLRLTETLHGARDNSESLVADTIKGHRSALRHTNTNPTTGGSSSSTPTTGDHGTLGGLADDDHPQYLRADGTRILTNDLQTLSGVLIDGVDLSELLAQVTAHVADVDAHHTPGTLSVSSVNANNGVETHAIESSSNPGASRSLLSTDEQGNITIRKISLEQFVLTDRITNQTYNVFIANGRMKFEPI